eukprot:CAMPEP_0194762632 /NCGR_PEP_ID=MMETSP0323_2-20130528/16376_1 /TAXON_ID=2866 ORGANISM="Crypthecodinium cohnii, Strain Seligo" /NCGR_SAMPLE_ID=MMETSP0323_2 /ASSEMBLY_ACC=CAM_ASM_000346 /LENGTH=36 /DNA_ID= /DNA_START= /DNA_END= /DNA_ORIENTATION=
MLLRAQGGSETVPRTGMFTSEPCGLQIQSTETQEGN